LSAVLRSFCGAGGGGEIKHLYVAENPLCHICNFILKSYIATTLPHIESFNGCAITAEEKDRSSSVFKRILEYSSQPIAPKVDPACSSRNATHHSSLDNSCPSGFCYQENAWTHKSYDGPDINYSIRLREDSKGHMELGIKKPVDKPPPPHTSSAFPSVCADQKKTPLVSTANAYTFKRGDLEYRFPYKSPIQQAPIIGSTPTCFFAHLLLGQQASLNPVASITHVVLQRRSIEEKFSQVWQKIKLFLKCTDTVQTHR
jgi:hypothetical protein